MEDVDEVEELLALARQGDEHAISRLYQLHNGRLLRVLRAEVGDAAEDVSQQTWLEVMRVLRRFEGDERGFRALLYTIARRRTADHRRTQRRKPAAPTPPETLAAVLDRSGASETDPLAALGADDAVRAVVAILGAEQAEVVLLRVVADLSVDEVAAIVGRSAGAVRVQQHRAMRRLAEALSEGDDR